jgi:hypothetical protein
VLTYVSGVAPTEASIVSIIYAGLAVAVRLCPQGMSSTRSHGWRQPQPASSRLEAVGRQVPGQGFQPPPFPPLPFLRATECPDCRLSKRSVKRRCIRFLDSEMVFRTGYALRTTRPACGRRPARRPVKHALGQYRARQSPAPRCWGQAGSRFGHHAGRPGLPPRDRTPAAIQPTPPGHTRRRHHPRRGRPILARTITSCQSTEGHIPSARCRPHPISLSTE